MATKRICDRCGSVIPYEATRHYAGLSPYRYEGKMSHELCGKCAATLRNWLYNKPKATLK